MTLGLSFIGYRTKRKNEENKRMNEANQIENNKLIDLVEKQNKNLKNEINENNEKINKELYILNMKLHKIVNATIVNNFDDFQNIKEIMDGKFDLNNLKNIKGVYIIWNKTKNRYYVGQTKNLYKRIFTQHFNIANGDVKNIIFAKDWFSGDEFLLKTIQLETKDELDDTEKYYIDMYDSFKNGYNSTSGNV